MPNGQRTHRREESALAFLPFVGDRRILSGRSHGAILVVFNLLCRPASPGEEGERAVVCHAKQKRPLAALTTEVGERRPERERHVLAQVFSVGVRRCIRGEKSL